MLARSPAAPLPVDCSAGLDHPHPRGSQAAATALSALDSAIAGAQSLGYAGADVAAAGTSRSEALCALLLLSHK